jgi:hypothetical protein
MDPETNARAVPRQGPPQDDRRASRPTESPLTHITVAPCACCEYCLVCRVWPFRYLLSETWRELEKSERPS